MERSCFRNLGDLFGLGCTVGIACVVAWVPRLGRWSAQSALSAQHRGRLDFFGFRDAWDAGGNKHNKFDYLIFFGLETADH